LTRFRFFFQKKNFNLVTFFDKNWIELKMITPSKWLEKNNITLLTIKLIFGN
jgi:hypothetical protein